MQIANSKGIKNMLPARSFIRHNAMDSYQFHHYYDASYLWRALDQRAYVNI